MLIIKALSLYVIETPVSSAAGCAGLFPPYPRSECLPLGVVLGVEVFAAIVEEIAARFLRKRMDQQLALHAAGHDRPLDDNLEVLPGLLLGPRRGAGIERLQPHWRAGPVARDASGVPLALRQEDRLDPGLEEFEIDRRFACRGRCLGHQRGHGPDEKR